MYPRFVRGELLCRLSSVGVQATQSLVYDAETTLSLIENANRRLPAPLMVKAKWSAALEQSFSGCSRLKKQVTLDDL